jgi:hypothetical protein
VSKNGVSGQKWIGHHACARTIEKQMDEFELIRWLDVLVETGMIRRWQKYRVYTQRLPARHVWQRDNLA